MLATIVGDSSELDKPSETRLISFLRCQGLQPILQKTYTD
jgi:hypothetical protein